MKSIILHLGAPKTGTTSIQKTLFKNRKLLKEHGITYVGRPHHYQHLMSAFRKDPKTLLRNLKLRLSETQLRKRDQAVLVKLRGEIENAETDCVIVSDEHIAMMAESELKALYAFFSELGTVHGVYYYRNVHSWANSFSQQLAKIGSAKFPASYEAAVGYVYDVPLRMAKVFGQENLSFVSFEESVKTGLIESFIKVIDEDIAKKIELVEFRANESLSTDATRLLHIYNRLVDSTSAARSKKLGKRIRKLPGPKYELLGFSKAQIADYEGKYAEVTESLGLVLDAPDTIPQSKKPDEFVSIVDQIIDAADRPSYGRGVRIFSKHSIRVFIGGLQDLVTRKRRLRHDDIVFIILGLMFVHYVALLL